MTALARTPPQATDVLFRQTAETPPEVEVRSRHRMACFGRVEPFRRPADRGTYPGLADFRPVALCYTYFYIVQWAKLEVSTGGRSGSAKSNI